MYPVKDADNGKIKYSGRSKAKVIDNRDPEQRGRIRVNHPTVGPTGWIPFLRKPHEFDVPKIGDVVYVEADSGAPTHLIAHGSLIDGIASAPNIPSEFQRDVPTNRGMKTPLGHKIEFDDGEPEPPSQAPDDTQVTTKSRGIRITTAAGNKIHISEDSDGAEQYILLEDINGNLIKLDHAENKISITSIDTIDITSDGDKTDTIGGDLTVEVEGNVIINCTDATVTASGTATIEGSEVNLGAGASEAVIKGDAFKTYFDTHTHPTPVGPSGPPTAPMPPANLSTKVKTE